MYAKLLMANQEQVLDILRQERKELEQQLREEQGNVSSRLYLEYCHHFSDDRDRVQVSSLIWVYFLITIIIIT